MNNESNWRVLVWRVLLLALWLLLAPARWPTSEVSSMSTGQGRPLVSNDRGTPSEKSDTEISVDISKPTKVTTKVDQNGRKVIVVDLT